ncbi:HAMP domain-containing histidine kinase [Listeria rocourtiae]|uniref:HAMP domain-containing sensor histidine kinase n=1 Tax=Listeria rocourtiae TaxID=647910 RepID=UPI0016253EE1|nr:HAMP domain-containing sensor histidine kinase [Listeria rocourtiae]MBC1434813.1 HAMP domain-containing histidine kinase [Listeria rocourtiae]MBC1604681.1 HAMP domain-containing histidine kinase [Listeria rocourtiae]
MLAIKWITKIRAKISAKIFFITLALLIVFTALIYAMLLLFLPNFYLDYKKQKLENGANLVVETSKTGSLQDIESAIDDFASTNNISPFLLNSMNQIVYIPFTEAQSTGQASTAITVGASSVTTFSSESNTSVEKRLTINGKPYTLYYFINIQPLTDISSVLLLFAPYFLIFVLILSFISAYFFSKRTVKPLLRMNDVANKMARLDFSENLPVNSTDEIGQLSRHLNDMAHELEGTLIDLQRVNIQLETEIAKERAQEETRKQFITAVSHELKSPIASVMGQLEAMIHRIGPYSDRNTYLKRSYETMEQMSALVQDMLEISRVDSADFEMSKTTFNLSTFISDCIQQEQWHPEAANRRLSKQITSDVFIHANQKLVEKAITNVIHNAFQYSKNDDKIVITLSQTATSWHFSIYNDAPKIPDEELTKLFDAFYRLEKSGNKTTGGSGIGLFITATFLEKSKLSYKIENQEQGVKFSIWESEST